MRPVRCQPILIVMTIRLLTNGLVKVAHLTLMNIGVRMTIGAATMGMAMLSPKFVNNMLMQAHVIWFVFTTERYGKGVVRNCN